ncbi:cytochrome c/ABC transporter substrate-binding protein [Pseudomonas sp. HLS-6 TE3448]|jgi:ABC-type branched-subunit amino acid transport system substrate-binding protein
MNRWGLFWLALLMGVGSVAQALELTPQEQAGKRLYREGLATGDAQVSARVGAADILVPASVVPCASCHGADGTGRPEGGVRPPALNWQRLTRGAGEHRVNGRQYPAYTEASLARVIQEGRDPAGNVLDPAMPRFVLSMADQRNLTAYLKRLAEDRDPGVEERQLRIGTLLPQSGPLAEAARVVGAVLQGSIERINQQGGIHGRQLQLTVVDPGPDRTSAEQALKRLIEQERVFALLSPLAPALGTALPPMLERSGVPMIGALSLPAASVQSRLIFEPLPGVREQLLSLADYAAERLGVKEQSALILYSGPEQAALADVLQQGLHQEGWRALRREAYEARQPLTDGVRSVFFLGDGAGLTRLTESLLNAGQAPYLFAASSQVAGEVANVPAQWSQRLFLAYPFVPGDWTEAGRAALAEVRKNQGLGGQQTLLQVTAYCSLQLLVEGLKRAGRDASREKLLAALEGVYGFDTGLTPPLSFGPGRRQGLSRAHVVGVELPGPRFHLQ